MAYPDLRGSDTSTAHRRPSAARSVPGAVPSYGARSVDVAALYAAHSKALRRVCLRLTRDPSAADDLSQEAFARLIARLPSLPSTVNVAAYLQVSARNLYLNGLRDHSREFSDDLIETRIATDDELERDPTRAVLLVEQIDQMRRSTARLNGRQRRALVLREVDGLSYIEIADRIGTSPEAVAQILARARARLRAEYRREQSPAEPVDGDCTATRDALSAYLDSKLSVTHHDDVERHLERCADCRDVLASYREAGIQLRGAGPLTPLGVVLERCAGFLQGLVGQATGTTAAVLSGTAIVAVASGGVVIAHHFVAPAPVRANTRADTGEPAVAAMRTSFHVVAGGSLGRDDQLGAPTAAQVGAGERATQTDPSRGSSTGDTGTTTSQDTTAATTGTGAGPIDIGTLPLDVTTAGSDLAITTPALGVPPLTTDSITTPPLTTPSATIATAGTPVGAVPPITIPSVTVPPISVPTVTVPLGNVPKP